MFRMNTYRKLFADELPIEVVGPEDTVPVETTRPIPEPEPKPTVEPEKKIPEPIPNRLISCNQTKCENNQNEYCQRANLSIGVRGSGNPECLDVRIPVENASKS